MEDIKFEKFEEQIFLNTVLIENLTDKEAGTGFLISKPKEKGLHEILLFSNKHVFWGKKDKDVVGIKKKLKLTFHKKEKDNTYKLGQVHSFIIDIDRNAKEYYFEHSNFNIDVACLNVSNLNNGDIKLNGPFLQLDSFINFKRNEIYAGMKVLFIGYPSLFYDKKNFLPVMRSGTIASIPSVDFNGEPSILLDAQVFPGSSGSPVFIFINNKYKLLGIISSSIQKGLDFVEIEVGKKEAIKKEKKNIPIQWIGLGLLFNSETIKEVYDFA
ncbi:MAG: serine protease [Candidatus ainarchaeum sp.]|nr:serine protease [Candidatus ainarchaeum sp.]